MSIEVADRIIDKYHGKASALVQILLEVQKECRWLSAEVLGRLAEKLEIPMARIKHIATFYKAFSLVPKGRHEVHVCVGTACHVRGAHRVLDVLGELTGLSPGETDQELNYSLDTVNCLGCCALGPVMVVDGDTHGKLSQADAARVLKRYE